MKLGGAGGWGQGSGANGEGLGGWDSGFGFGFGGFAIGVGACGVGLRGLERGGVETRRGDGWDLGEAEFSGMPADAPGIPDAGSRIPSQPPPDP